ncbi:cilia- and flagella-associated protein 221-like [Branchiostoma floridae x Branchiostoma japonicum]
MAMAAKPLNKNFNRNGMRTNGVVIPDTLVAPRASQPVPNHLLDTKIYTKVNQNVFLQARPAVIHFAGFELNKTQKQIMRVANVSGDIQRMHILPPATSYFKLHYTKPDRLVPGLTMDVQVEFTPDEWRYYYDCIRIHCKDDENLLIPIHAYPVMNTADFPSQVTFPPTPIGQIRVKKIPLRCNAPIDFEFQISFIQPHPAFKVEPQTGTVPANGEAVITVTFSPSEFITANMKIQVTVSQFNSKPLLCSFVGTSQPGLSAKTMMNGHGADDSDDMIKAGEPLDPHCISPIHMARRKKRNKTRERTRSGGATAQPPQDIEYEGLRFPPNLNTPYAVSSVLNQTPGKLRTKDLREAITSKKDLAPNTRQMKEALFEYQVQQDVMAERKNQLRWQVHPGKDQLTATERMEILANREEAVKEYRFQRGDPLPDIEFNRACTACSLRRTWRVAGEYPEVSPQFDLYKNDPWAMRHQALGRFAQAARKVIVRQRVHKKLGSLKTFITDWRKGKYAVQEVTDVKFKGEDDEIKIPLEMTAPQVKVESFPSYVPPDVKDDMAPDALGPVPAKNDDVFVKRKVPYFSLKVPKQYDLMGYSQHGVHDSSRGYVTPRLARPLRTGAEDEIIVLPPPLVEEEETAGAEGEEELVEDRMSRIELREETDRPAGPSTMTLVPPEALFHPPDYHPLHIFNPAPGLQVFMAPMPYAETDPDFHLCPLPRYTVPKDSPYWTQHLATQKKFLDREDVIKGIMSWKKFPSQGLMSLANTPTLTNVWVPRWSDPFSSDLLPDEPPPLLNSLHEEDRQAIEVAAAEEEGATGPELTPEMVNAQFSTSLEQIPEEPAKLEGSEFPHAGKLPSTNNPVSAAGPITREQREQELELYLQQRYNRLGSRVQTKVDDMERLVTNKDLLLK